MDGQVNHLEGRQEDRVSVEDDLELGRVFQTNLSMRDVAQLKAPTIKTTEEAILALKIGNARFFSGRRVSSDFSAVDRRAQLLTQTPFAVVLGCSDSRVPTEIIYDQRAGDLFVIRVAGNVVEASTLGSIEYAINHLKTRVVVVMGHEGCGAVHAAMLDEAERRFESQHIQFLINRIVPAVGKLPRIRDLKARMREAVIANVRWQVYQLKQNSVVIEATKRKEVAVIGAYYEISSGAVDFFETERELAIEDSEVFG